jgi:(heptosyl)LPS beta-1,4-glucosyltransferase
MTEIARPRLSVVVLTKDEAANLHDCLASARFADEIVVYDSGSRDRTHEIARELGARVVVDTDWHGFGVQRRRAQAAAQGAWILMLDADERITPELARSIQAAVARDDRSVVYEVSRLAWCFGRFIRHSGWYPDRVLRLYAAERAQFDAALVHEKLDVGPGLRVERLEGDLLHFTYKDLRHYLVKSADYAAAWADQRAREGRRSSLLEGVIHGGACFIGMYLMRAGFLDGRAGFLLAIVSTHSTFVKYADLWLRGQPAPPSRQEP